MYLVNIWSLSVYFNSLIHQSNLLNSSFHADTLPLRDPKQVFLPSAAPVCPVLHLSPAAQGSSYSRSQSGPCRWVDYKSYVYLKVNFIGYFIWNLNVVNNFFKLNFVEKLIKALIYKIYSKIENIRKLCENSIYLEISSKINYLKKLFEYWITS